MSTCNQSNGLTGGGIALIYKENLKVKLVDKVMMNTFGYGLWSITTDSKMINVLGLYHPPPSTHHQTIHHRIHRYFFNSTRFR